MAPATSLCTDHPTVTLQFLALASLCHGKKTLTEHFSTQGKVFENYAKSLSVSMCVSTGDNARQSYYQLDKGVQQA